MTDGGQRRRRFVHVFATFGRGGPQVRATQLIGALGSDVEHVVQAMDGDDSARSLLAEHGARVTFAPPPPRGGLLATCRRQARWLAAERPDLVLTYNWGAIESAWAARRAGLPLVHHEDGFGPEESRRRLWRRSLLRRWLLRGVPVVVPSQVLHSIATLEWRLGATNVHLLPNGVDLERFAPGTGAPRSGRLVLGAVGGLRPEKDHDNLLRAVAQLPAHVHVELIGSGPCEASLRQLAAVLGLEQRVHFTGFTDDTASCYRGFDVFVLSSRTEQMPIAMLEAMASGLPVVATDVGDVRRILPDVAADCVVQRERPEQLAVALQRLLDDEPMRARLGACNRDVVAARYEAGACLERFCALYRAAVRPVS